MLLWLVDKEVSVSAPNKGIKSLLALGLDIEMRILCPWLPQVSGLNPKPASQLWI